MPLAKQFLPTCKPLHVQEEAYHWRNGPCPPANHSTSPGGSIPLAEQSLPTCNPQLTSPGGSIPLAKQFLPICKPSYMSGGSIPLAERSLPTCKPQLHVRKEHTTGETVLAHLQTKTTCPGGSIPLAERSLPTCKPQLHVREEAYHWRNGPCPSANHRYMSGRKHITGGTVLTHLQTRATCPGGSISLAEQFLPTCKPQLHLREEAYHWRNGPCPSANHNTCPERTYHWRNGPCPSANHRYMSGRKHITGGTVLAHLQPHLQIQDEDTSLLPATLQSRSVVSRANFWSVSSPCWETNTVP